MELVLGAAFLLVARAYAEAAFFLTQKVLDLIGSVVALVKYAVALVVSGAIVLVTKFMGVEAVWLLLVALGFNGGSPDLPAGVDIPNLYWFALGFLTFLYAGGIYDWRSKLNKKKEFV